MLHPSPFKFPYLPPFLLGAGRRKVNIDLKPLLAAVLAVFQVGQSPEWMISRWDCAHQF